MPGGKTQSELGARLEKYYACRQVQSDLAEWERDEVFMAIAATTWPVDFESAPQGYQGQSARQRLRLRHEGFLVLTNARQQVEALHAAATRALSKFDAV